MTSYGTRIFTTVTNEALPTERSLGGDLSRVLTEAKRAAIFECYLDPFALWPLRVEISHQEYLGNEAAPSDRVSGSIRPTNNNRTFG